MTAQNVERVEGGYAALRPGYTEADEARWVPEHGKSVYRSSFERDRARLLHSSALRRLGAKTQVVSPDVDDFSRTRLTHSLEVAQVGRDLGRLLGCDPDVVDAACLSHDLGHPPFGHNGETVLNDLAAPHGGFEGNAQTLRLLTRLETKRFHPDGRSAGLNLTRASLDAAVKYPWRAHEAPALPDGSRSQKFGAYEDDVEVFDWIRQGVEGRRQSMEAQVMDAADDIAYSVHDIEDGVVNGRFQLKFLADPLQRRRVVQTTHEWYLPETDPARIEAALERLSSAGAWVGESDGSRQALAALKNMTSELIGRFCHAIFTATREVYGDRPLVRHEADLVVPVETLEEVSLMKGIAATYIMASREQKPVYARQREVIEGLHGLLTETGDQFLEPPFQADFHDASDEAARQRAIIDQIASLTDGAALEWYATLVHGRPVFNRLFA
ncbi:deoxyguanosinetriphosphate triphosphohydrolase [Nesterenkonia sp. AY15]|uniref:deoxyguanosinetriphosphate triphosphohydrolase n=1 Tax=unclassified Nesterenkonia TaxID=2629769 RepID=UPI001F4D22B1|nr:MULTISPECIES: deoxyguanosinetriphosphate triphosphohydrolase [unclassified Nesterenkonia]MCH8562095.1 deoxyguanosinetriphosphate triphosphohydrolase [Nesterenkonia sp. YGD6]MCH8570001.1 deoxyguanosinetriphosphate triphosphohydrolase [Nesterenkonia sp. AY15]